MSPDAEVLELIVRARRVVRDLKVDGKTSELIVDRLHLDFERAAKAALRRPHPLQRSRVLRSLIRRFVPSALRTLLKRVLVGVSAKLGSR